MNSKRWSRQYKQSVRRIKEFIMFDGQRSSKELPVPEEEIIERSSLLKELNERKKFFDEAQLEIGIEPEYIQQAREELLREREEREAKLIALDKRSRAMLIRITAMFAVIGVCSIPVLSFLLYMIIAICSALQKINIPLGPNLVSFLFDRNFFLMSLVFLVLGNVLFRLTVHDIERTDIPK